MRRTWLGWLLVVACYDPHVHAGAPCTTGVCAPGLVCVAATATCEFPGGDAGGLDATLSSDAAGDTTHDAAIRDAATIHDATHDAAHDATHDAAHDATPTGELVLTAVMVGSGNIDLTAEGTLDWAHWGVTNVSSFDHKATGAGAISNLADPPGVRFSTAPLTASSWSDGAPDGSASATGTGVGVTADGASMSFTAIADTTERTLIVYAGVQSGSATVDVALSDDSATAQSMTLTSSALINDAFTIVYRAATGAQTVSFRVTETGAAHGGRHR